jgi:hypothetical protein
LFDQKAESTAISRDTRISSASGAQLIDPALPAPNFFIVGAVKAGTTSLHAYLRQHPQVFMPTFKEPHYFASFVEVRPEFDNFEPVLRDSREYQALFRGSEGRKAVGEASPSYLCDSHAALRIKSAIPNAKIIISLRNPVERAYSHYLMEYREGRETRPFREAVHVDQARSEKGWGVSFEYVEKGLYAEQVERYLNAFGRSNVLVILFEDFIRKTPVVMEEVARFLDVDPALYPDSAFDGVHNPFDASRGPFAQWILRRRWLRVWSRRLIPRPLRRAFRLRFLIMKTKKPRLDEDTRRWLAELFAPDLQRLERLLGRDLGALRDNG